MRKAGTVDSGDQAQKLTSAFYANNIDAQVHEEAGSFTFWVTDEEKLDHAKSLFVLLKTTPDDPVFKTKTPVVPTEKDASDKLAQKANQNRARNINVRTEVFGRTDLTSLHVTIFLIVLSVLLTLVSNHPSATKFVRSLYFSEYMGNSFLEITKGEVWRLLTPIFLHGGMLHLFFNMLWLYQLGGAIERLEKPWYLALIVILTGVICNTAQYLISGPNFIGMSGVVYALLGYTWMMGTYENRSRYFISQGTVTFMLIWLVVCLVGIIPNVANTQHVAGMILGSGWGYLRAQIVNKKRR
jgi:GlpG protein